MNQTILTLAIIMHALTKQERGIVCDCINRFGGSDHPHADSDTLSDFSAAYACACIALGTGSDRMTVYGMDVAKRASDKIRSAVRAQ